jgi:GntR family transcriptional regulator
LSNNDIPATKLVYEQAQQFILEMINGPDYSAGERIPSERELAQRCSISRMTIRKAVDRLVDKGFLIRKGTSGTFIPSPVIMRPINAQHSPYSISDMVKKSGGLPGSKLLFFEKQKAHARIAEKLQLNVGDPIIVIRRLRMMDGIAFCVETAHLPYNFLPGLSADDFISEPSLYTLLGSRYGIRMGVGQCTIGISSATAEESRLLKIAKDDPCLIFRALTKDSEDRPIEYLTSINHPHLVVFETPLTTP